MRYALTLIFLLIYSTCFGWSSNPPHTYVVSSSGSCATQSVDESFTSADNSLDNLDYSETIGQGFTIDAPTTIYSITVKTGSSNGTAPVATFRLDDDKDLSADYLAEVTGVVLTNTSTEYEIILDTPVSVSAGIYYFALMVNLTTTNRLSLTYETSGGYPGGYMFYSSSGDDWDLTPYGKAWDIWFKVNTCD